MTADYGYIRGTIGADGDHLDCYLGPDKNAERVWVVYQRDLGTGGFDEHKCLLGFPTRDEALRVYVNGYHDGRGSERIGNVREFSLDEFRSFAAQF